MYRVLIVDDERLIREGLRGLIDWAAQGFEVVDVAADGVEALEKAERLSPHGPDLIVADIRMPRMDGLELLEALRKRGHGAHFLILSGFAEFEYAQRASAQRIDGYLLKPVDEAELVKRLTEVRRQLDARRFTALSLIRGIDRVPESYQWGRWQVVLVAPLNTSGQSALDSSAERRLRDACRERGWGEVFVEPPALGLLLSRTFPGGRNLGLLAREIAAALGSEVALFAAAAGPVADEAAAVAASYERARTLLQRRFFLSPGTITWFEEALPEVEPSIESLTEKLVLALDSSPEAVAATLQACADALRAGTEETVKEAFTRIVSGAIDRYLGAEARSASRTQWIADLWRQPFLSQLVAYLATPLEALTRERASSGLAEKLIDLIEVRYAENLKLEVLAEAFHYNSAYLGKLFRAKTGEYFNTYLDRVRIRRAQALLKEGLKVYQVAELVGYKYVDYFHAKFKKYTGVSPSQYKGTGE